MRCYKIIVLILVIFCFFSCENLNKSVFNSVVVEVAAEGYTLQEVENQITVPLEDAIYSKMDAIVSSTSCAGKCIITVKALLPQDSLLYTVREKIKEARLLGGINPYVMRYANYNLVRYTIESDKRPISELGQINSELLVSEFNRYPDVQFASAFGGGQLGVVIKPDLIKMNAYQVTLEELVYELDKTMSGFSNQIKTMEELSELVVQSSNRNIILLKDIATIELKEQQEEQAVFKNNGKRVNEGIVAFRENDNASQQFQKLIKTLQKNLPADISVSPFSLTEDIATKQQLILNAEFAPGTRMENKIEVSKKIATIILKTPQVRNVVYDMGVSLPGTMNEKSIVTFYIDADKVVSGTKMEESLSGNLSVPGVLFYFFHPKKDESSLDYSIKIFSNEMDLLHNTARDLMGKLNYTSGIYNLHSKGLEAEPSLNFTLQREAMAKFGIKTSAASQVIQTIYSGKKWENKKLGAVFLSLGEKEDVKNNLDLKLNTPSGLVSLSQVVKVSYETSWVSILRESGKRYVIINFTAIDEQAYTLMKKRTLEPFMLSVGKNVTVEISKD